MRPLAYSFAISLVTWEIKKQSFCPFLTRWILWHRSWKSKSKRSFHRLPRTLHKWMWPVRKSCVLPVHSLHFKILREPCVWDVTVTSITRVSRVTKFRRFGAILGMEDTGKKSWHSLRSTMALLHSCVAFGRLFWWRFSSVLEFSLALTVDGLRSHFQLGVCPRALSSPLW